MVLLISYRIRRYTIFHNYIHTISDRISGNELFGMWQGREDKRELYILSYGTQKPPCKAQASFILTYIYVCRKIYKLILLYYKWEIRQNVYSQPNRIRTIFGPFSLPIDSDSVFVSAHYPLWFPVQKMVTSTVSLLSVYIRSVFTPRRIYIILLLVLTFQLKKKKNDCLKCSGHIGQLLGILLMIGRYKSYSMYA
jgi:hypothetical protein